MRKYSSLIIIALVFVFLLSSFSVSASEQKPLKIGLMAEPSKLNPITREDTEAGFILSLVCDPLIEVDKNGSYTTEGSVISDYEISNEGKVYTFHVKKGVTFHNGEPLTAEDIKFTYESFMNKDLASPHREYYTDIEKLELIDDYTLKITLKKQNVTFLTTARLRGHIVPKDYVQEVGWQEYEQNPIGAGPYKFEKHDAGQRIVLKKYEDYWGENAEIETIEYRFYPEVSSAVMALQGGEVDFIAELPASEYIRLKKQNPDNLKFGSYKKFEDHRIVFNKREDSIFSNPKLRKAVAYAIDRQELIDLTRGEMAVPAVGRVPNFHPASVDSAKAYEKDLDKARELLAEAGYKDGFKTKIFAPSGYRERVLEVQQIQQQLSKIGIEVEVVTLEWGTYLDVTGRGDAPMFRERWSSTSPSPFSFVENWHSESGWNAIFGTYHNEKVDELIDEIKVTTDQKERWALYKEVQKIAMDDVASYPLYWPINGLAYNSELNIPDDLWNVFKRPIYFIDKWSYVE